jgi:hypothetical protein
LAPAPIPVRSVAVCERYAKESEVIEEKTSVAETILKAIFDAVAATLKSVLNTVAAALVEKTPVDESRPTGQGCADKAVSTGDKHAPAGDHAATEAAAEMRPSEPNSTEMHATTGEPTVHATESNAAVKRHGRRRHDDCRCHKPSSLVCMTLILRR